VVEHHTLSDWFRALGELARDPALGLLEAIPEFDFRA